MHLSLTSDQAAEVGRRHGDPVIILAVDAKLMAADGIPFFQARNGIWLTEHVEYKYCKEIAK